MTVYYIRATATTRIQGPLGYIQGREGIYPVPIQPATNSNRLQLLIRIAQVGLVRGRCSFARNC